MIDRRRVGRTVVAGAMAAVSWFYAPAVDAQGFGGFERPVVIRNARIITMTGEVIENGSIRIKGGVIEAIGASVSAPFLSKTIDVGGQTITPGLIDAWSSMGHLGASDSAEPTASAWDVFDRYAREDFREALRYGVTAVYVGPHGGPGVCGTGVVVRLMPDEGSAAGQPLAKEAALCVNLGSDQRAIARLKTLSATRKQFRTALDYRQALEDYEEDLKEYVQKIEERAAKKKKAGDAKDKKPEGEDAPPPDKKDEKPEKKDEEPDDGGGERSGSIADASVEGALTAAKAMTPPPARAGDNGDDNDENPESGEKKPDKNGEKKDDEEELKKPARPATDRASEVILRAIDHELSVRVSAHRSEDIFNALELADEFNLNIVIEGATDAYLLADALAKADAAVVFGPINRTGLYEANEFRRHNSRCAAALEQAGAAWSIGSGATTPGAARFVALNAQLAVARAGTKGDWLRRVTVDAASILGVSKRIGRLAPGMIADLVVWNGDPADPSGGVDRVFVGGRVVYEASGSAQR
jgi:imidazolonepropionase-like amidohydrolase